MGGREKNKPKGIAGGREGRNGREDGGDRCEGPEAPGPWRPRSLTRLTAPTLRGFVAEALLQPGATVYTKSLRHLAQAAGIPTGYDQTSRAAQRGRVCPWSTRTLYIIPSLVDMRAS